MIASSAALPFSQGAVDKADGTDDPLW